MKTEIKLLIISAAIAIVIGALAITLLGEKIIVIIYILIIALFIAIMPYFAYVFLKEKKLKDMEEHFPSFLRDLSESMKAGLTLPKAIDSLTQSNYGELTEEIKRINKSLSWGTTFPKAMNLLKKRVRGSRFMERGIAIIIESFEMGGEMTTTLESIANSTSILQEVEKDKVSTLQEQTMVIYMVQMLFVGIIAALYKILIPLLSFETGGEGFLGGIGGAAPERGYYKILFLLSLTIQSFCSAFVAGEAGEGKLTAGFKHIVIMLSVALIVFAVFILPTELEVRVSLSKDTLVPGEKLTFSGVVTIDEKAQADANVLMTFSNVEKKTKTDESGSFVTNIIVPEEPGEYAVKFSVEAKGYGKTEEVSFVVK